MYIYYVTVFHPDKPCTHYTVKSVTRKVDYLMKVAKIANPNSNHVNILGDPKNATLMITRWLNQFSN